MIESFLPTYECSVRCPKFDPEKGKSNTAKETDQTTHSHEKTKLKDEYLISPMFSIAMLTKDSLTPEALTKLMVMLSWPSTVTRRGDSSKRSRA